VLLKSDLDVQQTQLSSIFSSPLLNIGHFKTGYSTMFIAVIETCGLVALFVFNFPKNPKVSNVTNIFLL
jgi:hypothetical protein